MTRLLAAELKRFFIWKSSNILVIMVVASAAFDFPFSNHQHADVRCRARSMSTIYEPLGVDLANIRSSL